MTVKFVQDIEIDNRTIRVNSENKLEAVIPAGAGSTSGENTVEFGEGKEEGDYVFRKVTNSSNEEVKWVITGFKDRDKFIGDRVSRGWVKDLATGNDRWIGSPWVAGKYEGVTLGHNNNNIEVLGGYSWTYYSSIGPEWGDGELTEGTQYWSAEDPSNGRVEYKTYAEWEATTTTTTTTEFITAVNRYGSTGDDTSAEDRTLTVTPRFSHESMKQYEIPFTVNLATGTAFGYPSEITVPFNTNITFTYDVVVSDGSTLAISYYIGTENTLYIGKVSPAPAVS